MTFRPADIRAMFDAIVPEYDRFNRISSLGLDRRWRAAAARFFGEGDRVLDVGTGTGALARALVERGAQVTGVDLSDRMLASARRQTPSGASLEFVAASAEELPFAPRAFHGVVSAFVLRNLHRSGLLSRSFREFYRVIAPGGRVVHVELTRPEGRLMGVAHRMYVRTVIPAVGRTLFGDRWPAGYLSESIAAFPSQQEICREMLWAGFERVIHRPLLGGVASLFLGERCSI